MKQIRRSQKVYGVPILPQKIDAMYANVCRGNLMAYYLDADPVRDDPVYAKLKDLKSVHGFNPSVSEKVAEHFMNDMRARQMNERTYNHIRRMPSWLLKLEFVVRHETDHKLRRDIDWRIQYMFREPEKTWLDFES